MTRGAWMVVLAVVLALELLAWVTGTVTISQVVWAAHDRVPWLGYPVAFIAGLLCGHWFWPRKVGNDD